MDNYEKLKGKLEGVTNYDRYFSARCPLHNDSKPSLLVYPDGFKCLGCNRYGKLGVLLKAISAKNSPAVLSPHALQSFSLHTLSNQKLYETAYDYLNAFHAYDFYLKDRGVERMREISSIGYMDGWYTFPVFDSSEKLLGVILRASPQQEQHSGQRYMLRVGSELYVPDWGSALRARRLYVVFGVFDALALCQQGYPCVTSTQGKNFNPRWLDTFRYPITVIPDKGEEEEGRKLAAALGWRSKLLIIRYPDGCKDPNDLLTKNHTKELLCQLT